MVISAAIILIAMHFFIYSEKIAIIIPLKDKIITIKPINIDASTGWNLYASPVTSLCLIFLPWFLFCWAGIRRHFIDVTLTLEHATESTNENITNWQTLKYRAQSFQDALTRWVRGTTLFIIPIVFFFLYKFPLILILHIIAITITSFVMRFILSRAMPSLLKKDMGFITEIHNERKLQHRRY